MLDRTTLRRHADLLDRMADALAVDLQDAALRGKLHPGEIPDAVLRCAACPNPGHCAEWLERSGQVAAAPPEYCRNRAVLERLG